MIGDVPMRKFESQIRDPALIAALLEMIPIVHVGIRDGDGWPYVVPMSFGCELREDRLLVYLHCAREGHKVELWRRDPRVSLTFSVFQNRPNDPYRGSIHDYRSVMACGVIRQLPRGEKGGLHGRGVQAILRHNGRRPNQFDLAHYQFMDVYVVECDWRNVTAKAEEPIRDLSEVPFPTPEQRRDCTLPPFDYDAAFTRKDDRPAPEPPVPRPLTDTGTVHISKDIDVSINSSAEALKLSLRWSWRGEPPDCDLAALVLDREGRLPRRYDLAFYNQLRDRSGGAELLGDDLLTGRGQETLALSLQRLPDWCGQVALLLSVHRAEERRQHLGLLDSLLLTLEGHAPGERLVCALDTALWTGKGTAVAARLLRQPSGAWRLTGPDGRSWEDWRLTAVFPDFGLPEWRE